MLIKTQHIHLKQMGLTWAVRVCHNLNQELSQMNNQKQYSPNCTRSYRGHGFVDVSACWCVCSFWSSFTAYFRKCVQSTFDVTSTCWPFSSCIQTADPHLRLIWCKKVGKVMGFSVRSEGQNYSIYPKVPFRPSEACGRWASADRLHCNTTGNDHKKIQSVDVREGADCERVGTHFQSAKCQHNSTNSTVLFFFYFSVEAELPPQS